MNLISQLLSSSDFSPAERAIAQYILVHRDKISEMRINELAQQTYTSNAAIIRLCRKLGLDGFRSFKIRFLTDLEKYRQAKTDININYPFTRQAKALEVCRDLANLTNQAVTACYRELQEDTLQQACRVLMAAPHIYLFATGDSAIRALSFKNKLLKIGFQAIDANQFGEGMIYANYAQKEDCALFISYSGQNSTYLKHARVLHQHQTPIILITAKAQTPLAQLADIILTFPDLEDPANSIATFYSQIAIDYILNVLYSLIYVHDYAHNKKQKNTLIK